MNAKTRSAIVVVDLLPAATGAVLGAPTSDADAVGMWLSVFRTRSPHTFRTYFKESRRWLAFLEWRHGAGLPSLLKIASEDDVQAYLLALGRPHTARSATDAAFVPCPMPPDLLIKYRVGAQPFLREHMPASMSHALSAISALFKFLNKSFNSDCAPYASHNPTARLSRLLERRVSKASRHFSPRVYLEMLETIRTDLNAAKSDEHRALHTRRRWIVIMLYGLWIRVAEAAALSMASFKKSHGVWTVEVVGKGRKVRVIEVTAGVIAELSTYRVKNGLPGLLLNMETDVPAILPVRKRSGRHASRSCSASSIYKEVKLVAQSTADRLELCGTDLPGEEQLQLIENIRSISPHWFRHSGASEAINDDYPLPDAAERLGHSSINTTSQMYYHADSKKKRDALEKIESGRLNAKSEYFQ